MIVIAVVAGACDKSKFNTKPTLTLKSQNGDILPPGSSLVLDFEFTDKEGDVDDTIYVKKIRTNAIKVPTIRDSFALQVPTFPKNTKGEIRLTLEYNGYMISAINPPLDPTTGKRVSDTLTMKFALKDRGNNISDTVTIGPIVVLRN
jgi:hypothetical protein